jgi:cytochrome c oxidase subunit 2
VTVVASLALVAAAVGCDAAPSGAPSPLNPRTVATTRIAELGWAMIIAAAAVCVIVLAALLVALFRRRPDETWLDEVDGDAGGGAPNVTPAGQPVRRGAADSGNGVVVIGGMALPAVVIALTLGYTVYTLREVAGVGGPGAALGTTGAHAGHEAGSGSGLASQPSEQAIDPVGGQAPALAVHLIGHQWWWEVTYPDEQVVTANEIHVPAGSRVRLTVTSEDVIHSFWIPQVAGKVDVIPRKTNAITFRVDQPGVYQGMCAEFCGLQHAHMRFRLVVEPPADFDSWLAGQRQAPSPPAGSLVVQGQQVFARASCAECHAVRGVAAGRRGPDLTHVASRRTLGAGTHENTPETLSGWVADPQAMKQGNKMPPTNLSEEEVRAVVAYLSSLE